MTSFLPALSTSNEKILAIRLPSASIKCGWSQPIGSTFSGIASGSMTSAAIDLVFSFDDSRDADITDLPSLQGKASFMIRLHRIGPKWMRSPGYTSFGRVTLRSVAAHGPRIISPEYQAPKHKK